MTAVVAAVVMISVVGIGTSTSVKGTSISCVSFGRDGVNVFSFGTSFLPSLLLTASLLTPGGGLRSLGGTTSGGCLGSSTSGASRVGTAGKG
tara:strand:- start:1266 stop:1541 length:276 start_codon:yes stop_codon:yes gene_type:complete